MSLWTYLMGVLVATFGLLRRINHASELESVEGSTYDDTSLR